MISAFNNSLVFSFAKLLLYYYESSVTFTLIIALLSRLNPVNDLKELLGIFHKSYCENI